MEGVRGDGDRVDSSACLCPPALLLQDGKTALDYARRYNHAAVVAMLQQPFFSRSLLASIRRHPFFVGSVAGLAVGLVLVIGGGAWYSRKKTPAPSAPSAVAPPLTSSNGADDK